MDADDRARLRALAEKATAGSWEPRTDDLTDEVDVWANGDTRDSHVAFVGMPEEPRVHADAEFIAAARTAVPALLDHIDQLEAQLAEARATKNMHKDRYEDLLASVERIRALHEHRTPEPPYVEYCEHCGADWPCQTVRVLDDIK